MFCPENKPLISCSNHVTTWSRKGLGSSHCLCRLPASPHFSPISPLSYSVLGLCVLRPSGHTGQTVPFTNSFSPAAIPVQCPIICHLLPLSLQFSTFSKIELFWPATMPSPILLTPFCFLFFCFIAPKNSVYLMGEGSGRD